jgi:large subunit ribosomal protein L7Ae
MVAQREFSKEVMDKAYEAIRQARQTGSVRKGANEATKSIERGLATLIVVAGDVTPMEVVMHLPILCEQKKVPFIQVPAKLELGKAVGLNVPCAAVAVEKPGESERTIREINSMLTGKSAASGEAKHNAGEAQNEKKEHKKEKQ